MGGRGVAAYAADAAAALVVTAAAAAACATVWWAGVALSGGTASGGGAQLTSAAVLATVVALSLGRRTFATRAEFARSAVLLPVIGLVAGAVGWLLVAVPPVGAALFVAGMSIPIWMRRFGERAARLGGLIALPLTAMLVAPVQPAPDAQPWRTTVLVLLAGIVATLWVGLAREILLVLPGRKRSARDTAPAASPPRPPRPPRDGSASSGSRPNARSRRLPASTRMALQMAVALTAAFVVGWIVFPDHAMWVVLTAFLVCSGNRGRGDVLHKSALRILGALGGTIAAVALTTVAASHAAPEASGFAGVVVIFVALFVGTWLRGYSYAFWALTVTLVLSLLQQLTGTATLTGETGMLAERMLAIVVGAALGIAASWFVLPVRSIDVLRQRLSELLAALADAAAVDPEDPSARTAARQQVDAAVDRIRQLAPAHRATRLVHAARPRRGERPTLPIDCIDAVEPLPAALDRFLTRRPGHTADQDADATSRVRAAVARARAALAEPVDPARLRAGLSGVTRALGSD
ncbi:FUSC family protein [Leifsonia shinshuensis]|uniref:FUSC family protein n=1 Tax=Leifsonia shinshuensis TaxID=150026 RepID=UPI00286443EC|nr:FUSC family protein [Leifsonia shinshuensis]MDR6972623.1 hypothetical protein [Leifsonia shinshuensis]